MVDLGSRQAPDLEALARLAPDLIVLNRTVLKAGWAGAVLAHRPTRWWRAGTGGNWRPDFLLLADALGRRQQASACWRTWILSWPAWRSARRPAPSASLLFSSGRDCA